MIRLEDRQRVATEIQEAHHAGARLAKACALTGISVRTLQRWQAKQGLVTGDRRPQASRPLPSHALTAEERAQILAVANEPRFAALPPARIVPMLADEGVYIASESSFHRVLRAHGQTRHRGRSRAPPCGPNRPATSATCLANRRTCPKCLVLLDPFAASRHIQAP